MKISMPRKELRVRMIRLPQWGDQPTTWIDHRFYPFTVIYLAVDQDRQVISKPNESSIKHPMRSARQRQAIAHTIRTTMFDRANVRRLCFQPAATVDQSETRERAAPFIGIHHRAAKRAVAERAGYKGLH